MTDARYRILRRLGQGGMAEVFEAELAGELGFSRKVAIKRMLPDAATELASAKRFIDEAQIASRLHHANIVSVIDVGLLDGLPFQVLELVDGINAHQLMSRAGGKLPIDIALIIAGDVAHGLDHAHTAHDPEGLPLGIVHRDVKPANVLLSWSGDVKLGDFGIAVARDRSARTETGVVAGTSGFIAPEQRTRSEIDGRTDVFALGLTLHALIVGYSPLRDVTVEMAVMAGDAVPLDPSLPPEIARLIARAVAPGRLDRLTAAAFAEAIGAVLAPRMLRDTRGHLREFLAPFHDSVRAKAGALDQLLGLDVVPEPANVSDAPAHFALRPTHIATIVARPRPKRRRAVAIAVAVGVVASGGAAVTWRLARTTPTIAAVDAHADSVPDAPPDAPIDAPADAPIDALVDAVDAATRVVHEHRDAGHTMPGDATAPVGTGWLQIVGEDVIGTTVVVDGQALGHVPNPIEVPVGHHRIQLRRLDGTLVQGTRDVDITEANTQAHPLRRGW